VLPRIAPALGILLVGCVCCGPPPELTESEAASIIQQQKHGEALRTTYLNPMKLGHCVDKTRFLVHCESAGLAKVQWLHHEPPCGDFTVELTEKGEQYLTGVHFSGRPGLLYTTQGWHVTLQQPITTRVVEVTRTEDLAPGRKQVDYTRMNEFPPILLGCTRDSQAGTQQDSAVLTWAGNEWRLE
jgi:hypothetical protein